MTSGAGHRPPPRRVILLAPPLAGKSTQAAPVAGRLGVPHLSTGELLRAHRERGTDIGRAAAEHMARGDLVPDDLVLSVVTDGLSEADAANGVVLDGVPRDLRQAEVLDADARTRPDLVLLLEVPDAEVRRRAMGRRRCPNGHVYHLTDRPPRAAGRCDVDGQPLAHRDDDRPEAVERRLTEYLARTGPVIEHYRRRGILRVIDGTGSPEEVTARVLDALA